MNFKLNFNMDNAAFDLHPESEIHAILEEIGYAVMQGKTENAIKDDNGNTIGSWEITI